MNPEMIEKVLGYGREIAEVELLVNNPKIYENLSSDETNNLSGKIRALDDKIASSDIPNYFKESYLTKTKNYSRLVGVTSSNPAVKDYVSEALISSIAGIVVGILGTLGADFLSKKFSKDLSSHFESYLKGSQE